MLKSTLCLTACLTTLLGALAIPATADETRSPATQHVQQLRERIAQIQSKPAADLTVADRLELSAAYLQLGQTTFAVKNAFLARQAEPQNELTWIALVRAQIANRHEVGYAEENFQAALRKFPHSDGINQLREELFFGQIKYGQPTVAVNHLAGWLRFELNNVERDPADLDHTFATAQRLIEVLGERRVPLFALTSLRQQLEQLQHEAPQTTAERIAGLVRQINTIVGEMTPAERSLDIPPGL